jgi:hypothetical protein
MNTDRYTKAVLTVIAGCLLWICAMGSGPSLAAQPAPFQTIPNLTVQPVVIVGTGTLSQNGTVTISYVRQPDGALRAGPTLPVTLPYTVANPLPVGLPYTVASPLPAQVINMGGAPLPVEISAERKTADWDPIRVRVEPGTQSLRPGGGGQ